MKHLYLPSTFRYSNCIQTFISIQSRFLIITYCQIKLFTQYRSFKKYACYKILTYPKTWSIKLVIDRLVLVSIDTNQLYMNDTDE